MGELWLTFFTPGSHAAKHRRRRHLIDSAAAAEKFDRRVAGRRRWSKSPGAPPPKE